MRHILCYDDRLGYIFADKNKTEKEIPGLRQVIPYVITVNHEGKIALFQRMTGDKRLKSQYSIGIGGHIEIEDFDDTSWDHTIYGALLREYKEETGLVLQKEQVRIIGCITSSDTPVDKVHVGVVLVAQLTEDQQPETSDEMRFVGWHTKPELEEMELESWSIKALVIKQLPH